MLSPSKFAKLARAQVGKPYILGAEARVGDNDPEAFDCSELVEWLFGRAGVKITDLAAAQFDATEAVNTPRVGDLVFLKNNPARWNRVGHVAAIYGGSEGVRHLGGGHYEVLGEPQIIEAKGRAYGVVRSTLKVWQARAGFTGLRRYPKFELSEPNGTRPTYYYPTIRRGDSGRLVRLAQEGILRRHPVHAVKILNRLGASRKAFVDGQFGETTERVWTACAELGGIRSDGIIRGEGWKQLHLAEKVRVQA